MSTMTADAVSPASAVGLATCSRLVAERRHLPGLRAQLPGLRRRRRRRPRRRARQAPVPAQPRRRRHLAQPVLPLAAARPWLRRVRLPRRPPRVRHDLAASTGWSATRTGSTSRSSSTSSRTTARSSTRGSLRRWPPARAARSASASTSPTAGASTASCRRTTGAPSSADRPGSGSANPMARPGQWYLHSFAAEQADFNWRHPDVAAYFEQVLRFWFDRGVDGAADRRRARAAQGRRAARPRERDGRRAHRRPGQPVRVEPARGARGVAPLAEPSRRSTPQRPAASAC